MSQMLTVSMLICNWCLTLAEAKEGGGDADQWVPGAKTENGDGCIPEASAIDRFVMALDVNSMRYKEFLRRNGHLNATVWPAVVGKDLHRKEQRVREMATQRLYGVCTYAEGM